MTAFALPEGFHAVVIGGAGDIGAAICRQFVELGATVTATGHSDKLLQICSLADITQVNLRKLDVTDSEAVQVLAGEYQKVDALINCAGILERDKEFEIDVFQKVIDVNLTGTYRTCAAFHDHLKATEGVIVNIASMNAFAALPRIPAYCASKGGVVMLTKALALAWADDKIRVNAVAPGYVETAMNEEGRRDLAHKDRITARTALKRWGRPEDIAGAVAFLCMPASRYVTGSVYNVDGGFLAG